MPARRVLAPALLVAAGLELLKNIGRLYVQRTEANQLVLFAAALTATDTTGRPADLATRAG